MNRLLIGTFFILFQLCVFSQNSPVTKKQLFKAFKQSIEQKDSKSIYTDSNPWLANNIDSLYYKADTIVFINAKSFKRDYCRVINWSFYKKDRFILSDANSCKEPPTARVNQPTDWFSIKIIESDTGLFFDIYNFNAFIDRFQVISLLVSDQESVLKIKRIKS